MGKKIVNLVKLVTLDICPDGYKIYPNFCPQGHVVPSVVKTEGPPCGQEDTQVWPKGFKKRMSQKT